MRSVGRDGRRKKAAEPFPSLGTKFIYSPQRASGLWKELRHREELLRQLWAGRPGLLEIVNNLHTLGFCRGQDMSGSESLLTADSDTNVSDLFTYMRTLISALPDRHLVSALDRSTAAVQNDLNKVIF